MYSVSGDRGWGWMIFLLSGPHLIPHRTDKHCDTEGSLLPSKRGTHANTDFGKMHCGCPHLFLMNAFWQLDLGADLSATIFVMILFLARLLIIRLKGWKSLILVAPFVLEQRAMLASFIDQAVWFRVSGMAAVLLGQQWWWANISCRKVQWTHPDLVTSWPAAALQSS